MKGQEVTQPLVMQPILLILLDAETRGELTHRCVSPSQFHQPTCFQVRRGTCLVLIKLCFSSLVSRCRSDRSLHLHPGEAGRLHRKLIAQVVVYNIHYLYILGTKLSFMCQVKIFGSNVFEVGSQ